MKKVFFGEPDLNKEEIHAVIKVLKSRWIGFGKVSMKFEERLAHYLGVKHGAILSSCTAALHLSLILHRVQPGDEIITTPLTFAATANAIFCTGAKPVFVDINPRTLNIDESLIEKAITPKTKGIMAVHFGGLPCNMGKINTLAKKRNLFVVEDAAHAMGARIGGKMVGNSDNLTCFSFYANKNLTTNEGGFLASNRKAPVNEVKILRLHGLTTDAWRRYSDKTTLSAEVIKPGYKYNITDLQSAIGLVQLKKMERNFKTREKYARVYDQVLSEVGGISLQNKFNNKKVRHALHLYVVILEPDQFLASRDEIVLELRKNGIHAVIHYKPLHLHKFYKEELGYQRGDFVMAEKAGDNIFTLPLLPQLHFNNARRIALKTRDILLKHKKKSLHRKIICR